MMDDDLEEDSDSEEDIKMKMNDVERASDDPDVVEQEGHQDEEKGIDEDRQEGKDDEAPTDHLALSVSTDTEFQSRNELFGKSLVEADEVASYAMDVMKTGIYCVSYFMGTLCVGIMIYSISLYSSTNDDEFIILFMVAFSGFGLSIYFWLASRQTTKYLTTLIHIMEATSSKDSAERASTMRRLANQPVGPNSPLLEFKTTFAEVLDSLQDATQPITDVLLYEIARFIWRNLGGAFRENLDAQVLQVFFGPPAGVALLCGVSLGGTLNAGSDTAEDTLTVLSVMTLMLSYCLICYGAPKWFLYKESMDLALDRWETRLSLRVTPEFEHDEHQSSLKKSA